MEFSDETRLKRHFAKAHPKKRKIVEKVESKYNNSLFRL